MSNINGARISADAYRGVMNVSPVLCEKEVVPIALEQTVLPDAGCDGLSKVTVKAIDYIFSEHHTCMAKLSAERYDVLKIELGDFLQYVDLSASSGKTGVLHIDFIFPEIDICISALLKLIYVGGSDVYDISGIVNICERAEMIDIQPFETVFTFAGMDPNSGNTAFWLQVNDFYTITFANMIAENSGQLPVCIFTVL